VTAVSDLDVLVIGPREFASLAAIPGFRGALLRHMAQRLDTVDAQLAEERAKHDEVIASDTGPS
jgi:CRP-like cAMP-binding protein